ncbi:MAG TPA: HigA family addiction module antitoxin [candidate division Zixibacteria bacterium]|nr:HigA family addiction module antitoxin [candidate division Zixibacteria bacterium]
MANNDEKLAPVHPGVVLLEEFLNPMNLSQNRLALDIRVPARRINEIVLGKRRITPDTALRLARFFDMSPEYWLGLQMDYDLDVAEDEFADTIRREVQVYGSR